MDLLQCYLQPSGISYRDVLVNIVGFIPVGVLVGVMSRRHRVVKALLAGVLLSLAIEGSQLIWKKGVFDVDDLFNNAVGAMMWVLGFMVNGSRFTDDEKVKKEDWMLCEPNEKEGTFLLNEIISPDDGKKKLKKNSIKRMLVFVTHYPSEILWVLPWKVWHRGWRAFHKV